MTIETLELIHKILKEHTDKACRCRDRAREKMESIPDNGDRNYTCCDMKYHMACSALNAARMALRDFEEHDFL